MSDAGTEPTPVQPTPVQPPRRKGGWRLVVIAVTLGALAVPVIALLLRADPEGGDKGGLTEEEERGEALTFLHPDSPEALPIEPDSSGALFLQWNSRGTALAYVRGADIWLLDEEGTNRNLTETPQRVEGHPSWSPDGSQIAFGSRRLQEGEEPQGLIGPPGDLTLMNEDGSGYEVVGQGPIPWPPSWSREGRRIAWATGDTLEVLDPRTNDHRSFPAADLGLEGAAFLAGPVWSPTSDEIVVYFSESAEEPSREELLAGTAPAVRQGFALVTPGARDATVVYEYRAPFLPASPAGWSPDAKRLLINLASSPISANPVGLLIVDREGGKPVRARGVAAYQAVWSPTGDRIAYVDLDERRIVVIDAETLDVLDEPGPEGGVEGIAWRPAA